MTKEEKIIKVAQHIAESMDVDDLVQAFCDNQIEYFEGLSDEDFEQELIDIDVGFDEEGNLIENYEY